MLDFLPSVLPSTETLYILLCSMQLVMKTQIMTGSLLPKAAVQSPGSCTLGWQSWSSWRRASPGPGCEQGQENASRRRWQDTEPGGPEQRGGQVRRRRHERVLRRRREERAGQPLRQRTDAQSLFPLSVVHAEVASTPLSQSLEMTGSCMHDRLSGSENRREKTGIAVQE